jgi:ABC-2 type transport system permease protein
MRDHLRSEWIKLWSGRGILVLTAIGFVMAVGWASLLAGIADQRMDLESALIGIHLSPLLFMILGIQVIGQEYRFNTIRITFAASPRRVSVLGAKAVVLAVVVAGIATFLSVASILAAVLVTGARGRGFEIDFEGGATLIAGTVVNCLVMAEFAFAVTCIVRHQVAAIVAVVLWFTAVEGTLIALFDGAGRWLPLSSTFNLVTVEQDAAYLSPLLAALYSTLVCVAIGAVGIARIVRADA